MAFSKARLPYCERLAQCLTVLSNGWHIHLGSILKSSHQACPEPNKISELSYLRASCQLLEEWRWLHPLVLCFHGLSSLWKQRLCPFSKNHCWAFAWSTYEPFPWHESKAWCKQKADFSFCFDPHPLVIVMRARAYIIVDTVSLDVYLATRAIHNYRLAVNIRLFFLLVFIFILS